MDALLFQQCWNVILSVAFMTLLGVTSGTGVDITRRANLTVSSKSPYPEGDYSKEYVLDGRADNGTNFDTCACCFSTDAELLPTFTAQFEGHYQIENITIIGRNVIITDDRINWYLYNLEISVDSQNVAVDINNATNTAVATNVPTAGTITLTRPHHNANTNIVLMMCVLQVFASGCGIGYHGEYCNLTCPANCDGACDRTSGHCEICIPGFMGDTCDELCPHGTFGNGCAATCHCLDDAACNNVNGICDNRLCTAGWRHENCSEACFHGTFGLNCSSHCHCRDDAVCANTNGVCDNGACAPGWLLANCSEACGYRLFGPNCSTTCHCVANTSCDHVHGKCEIGICEPGWEPDTCSEEVAQKSDGKSLLAPIAGGVSALVGCIAMIFVLLVVIFRMRKALREKPKQENEYRTPDAYITPTDVAVYDTLSPDQHEIDNAQQHYANA